MNAPPFLLHLAISSFSILLSGSQLGKFTFFPVYIDLLSFKERDYIDLFLYIFQQTFLSFQNYFPSENSNQNLPNLILNLSTSLLEKRTFNVFYESMTFFYSLGFVPIIMLDHFDFVCLNPQVFNSNFFNNFRFISTSGKLSFVLGSSKPLFSYKVNTNKTSVYYNVYSVIKLKGFTEEDCSRLITMPGSTCPGLKPALIPRFYSRALDWGKNNPANLQLACYFLYRVAKNKYDVHFAFWLFKKAKLGKFYSDNFFWRIYFTLDRFLESDGFTIFLIAFLLISTILFLVFVFYTLFSILLSVF